MIRFFKPQHAITHVGIAAFFAKSPSVYDPAAAYRYVVFVHFWKYTTLLGIGTL